MARGTQLIKLVEMYRTETGQSINTTMNQADLTHVQNLIRRTQEVLYHKYEWSFLDIFRDETMTPGNRYYTLDADLSYDSIQEVWTRKTTSDAWQRVDYGITPDHYNDQDSDSGDEQDPVRAWDYYEGGQIEVWPIPVTATTVRFFGKEPLGALLANNDTSTLDDNMIILTAAAETLLDRQPRRAEALLATAADIRMSLIGNQAHKRPVNLGSTRVGRTTRPAYGWLL